MSPRSTARGNDQLYAGKPRRLRIDEIVIGAECVAGGKRGRVISVAYSVATERHLVTVEHSQRDRPTYLADEIFAAD
jgi:hypothetical protein